MIAIYREALAEKEVVIINGKKYTIRGLIGRGGCSLVYLADEENNNSHPWILKEFFPNGQIAKREKERRDNSYRKVTWCEGQKSRFENMRHRFLYQENRLGNILSEITFQIYAFDCVDEKNGFAVMKPFSKDTKSVLEIVKEWEANGASLKSDVQFLDLERIKKALCMTEVLLLLLKKIHNKQILHLDLSFNNVLGAGWDKASEAINGSVFILDFGCAVKMDGEKYLKKIPNYYSYSPGFAAPEILDSKVDSLDFRTDIYSVGALLYYLCVGSHALKPIGSSWRYELYNERKQKNIINFLAKLHVPSMIKGELINIIMKSCSANPEKRFQTAEEMQIAIEQVRKKCDLTPYRLRCLCPDGTVHFVGREKEKTKIKTLLENNQMIAICGDGGLGKSELAFQVAKESMKYTFYRTSFEESLGKTIENLQFLELLPLEKDETMLDCKFRCLQRHDSTAVLIIDNCDIAEDMLIADKNFQRLKCLKMKIIFTSRYEYHNMKNVQIKEFGNEEAVKLIEEHYHYCTDRKMLEKLAKTLAYHTLTIEIVSKMLEKRHGLLSIEDVVWKIEKGEYASLEWPEVSIEYRGQCSHKRILGHLLTLFDVSELSDVSKMALKMISIVGENGMPLWWFFSTFGIENEDVLENELLACGWIKNRNNIIYMHPLIKVVVSNTLVEDARLKNIVDSFIDVYERKKEYSEENRELLHQVVDSVLESFSSPSEQKRFCLELCKKHKIYNHAHRFRIARILAVPNSVIDINLKFLSIYFPKTKLEDPQKRSEILEYNLVTTIEIAEKLWNHDDVDLAQQYMEAGEILCSSSFVYFDYYKYFEQSREKGKIYFKKALDIFGYNKYIIYKKIANRHFKSNYFIKDIYKIALNYTVASTIDDGIIMLQNIYNEYPNGGVPQNSAEISIALGSLYECNDNVVLSICSFANAIDKYSTISIKRLDSIFESIIFFDVDRLNSLQEEFPGTFMKKNIITMVNWAILNKWDTNILEMGLFKSETDASAYLFHSLLIEGYRKKYQEQRDTDSKVKILENINECLKICEKYPDKYIVLLAKQISRGLGSIYTPLSKESVVKVYTDYANKIINIMEIVYQEIELAESLIIVGRKNKYWKDIFLNRALPIYESLLSDNDVCLANLYEELGNNQEAFKRYEKYQLMFTLDSKPSYDSYHYVGGRQEELKWELYLPMSDILLAEKYYYVAEKEKNIDYAEKAWSLYKKNKKENTDKGVKAYKRYIQYCIMNKQKVRLNIALDEIEKNNISLFSKAEVYRTIFESNYSLKKYNEAEKNGILAIECYKKSLLSVDKIISEVSSLYWSMAELYANWGDKNKTEEMLTQLQLYDSKYLEKVDIKNVKLMLKAAQGKYKDACEYLRLLQIDEEIPPFFFKLYCVFGPLRSWYNRHR